MSELEGKAALSGVRVLDLADEKGVYCGKLLAEMGADVLKVEPPGGDATRRFGPFVHDIPDPERSLFFMHFNTSKRGITLCMEHPEGRELFKQLAQTADAVVETFPPGHLQEIGLGYEDLNRLNPRLILVSITPFGQTGPYRDYKGSDLIACALGGQMYLSGDADTSPLRCYGDQSYHMASCFATIGLLTALYERNFSEEGQHIDVSLEESMAAVIEPVIPYYVFEKFIPKRQGTLHWTGGFQVFESKDGHVLMPVRSRFEDMVTWLELNGMAQDLADPKYATLEARKENTGHLVEVIGAFAKTKTTAELVEYGQLIRAPFADVRLVEDLLDDEHFQARGFFITLDHPEFGGQFKYPGAPFQAHGSPYRVTSRAPHIGEHNLEVYRDELHLTESQLAGLRERGVI